MIRIDRTSPRGICYCNGGGGISREQKPLISSIRDAFTSRLNRPPIQADFTNAFLFQMATDLYHAGKNALAALGTALHMSFWTSDGQEAGLPAKFKQLVSNPCGENRPHLDTLLRDGLPIDQSFQTSAATNRLTFPHLPANLIEGMEEQPPSSEVFHASYYLFALDQAFSLRSKNPDESLLWFKTAILIFPNNEYAYIYAAGILNEKRQPDKVAEVYSAVIPLLPEGVKGMGYFQRSVCHCEMGRLEQAEEDLKQALRFQPELLEAQFNLADIYMRTNRQDQALPMFMTIAEKAPAGKKARAFLNVGTILAKLERNDKAISYFEKAVRDDPGYAQAYFNWGMVLLKTPGNSVEALERIEKSLELDPTDQLAQYFKAVVLFYSGRREEAFAWCREKLLRPDASEEQIIAFLTQSEELEKH